MSACFGYVPLTIFVPAWLLADRTHMSNRRKQSSSCSDVVSYVGLRVPSEWRQSFLMWSTNVWSHTLPDGSLSDVGAKNEDLAEQAITDSKANGDHRYFDNPYILGGAMENINPWTGRYQVGWDR